MKGGDEDEIMKNMFFLRKTGAQVFAAWVVLSVGESWAQQDGPRLSHTTMPATPVYSKDGTVVVYASSSKAGYRMPVLSFVSQCQDELQRVVRLKLGSQACPLEIAIGGQNNGDTRVLTARLRDSGGGLRERIELPDPEAADLMKFKRAICVALLRAWMVDAGGTEETMRDLPGWLIDGIVRYLDRETRPADVDRTLLLWSRACLPPAKDLFEAESLAAMREPAVSAVLASWFLEKRPEMNPLEALLRGAATGTEWKPEVAALLLAGTNDPYTFDNYVDGRLMGEGRVVAKLGLTTIGIMRRFRSHLLLYPSYYGKMLSNNHSWCTFQEAVTRSGDPDVRQSAAVQLVHVKTAAAGRDGMLLAVSEAYGVFLDALARGAKEGELSRLLMEAEGMRRDLETRTARGAVLQRSVER